jgi:hypothetical protein
MNRWRKQVRVNGVMTQTLRLRHYPSADKGVMVSLMLTQEKDNPHLSLEVDGDCVVPSAQDEYALLCAAMELLRDAIDLVDPAKQPTPVKPPLRKERTDFPL